METKTISASVEGGRTYSVVIGSGLGKELREIAMREAGDSRIVVITDKRVEKMFGAQILSALETPVKPVELFSFADGERNKNQKTVTALQHELLKGRYGRDTLIIALGGGIVGDVAGFVAATYLRGVPYINVPTTVLAMVDSSIGGKVGIDTKFGKNTIGSFWLPRGVIVDIQYLAKMPRGGIVNGLLEAVKTFMTSDKEALSLVPKLNLDEPLKTPDILQEIIFRSVSIKVGVTGRDVREGNERMIVNFGHTIGHAIELLSGYRLPHGYAVGYGILAEAKISELLGILSSADCAEIYRHLAGLGITPKDFPRRSPEEILEATLADKKTRGGVPRYVLLETIGKVHQKDGQYAHPVEDDVVRKALGTMLNDKS
ncbi:MAG: 3-dehydroquinate synthase [bacterium]|nr:3-dehydroquinate synthase [bacterium]